jgi:hypothetical protein
MRDSMNVTRKPNNVRRASLCAVSRGGWNVPGSEIAYWFKLVSKPCREFLIWSVLLC